ncbi:YLP motif-containing protein 1 [Dufourea novaeangliae]|uniref:YLP motif-containing protein 1 n=1 Tax=Dufourea novaeangliae TaxID=178035 RepID=A0A154PJK3_DUFNO|nr:YLP motif-containing protein 1 [Dufourea novaeangliae]
MQNWNQWQLSAGAVASTMPQPPVYAAPGADPMAMMQAYMQYYSQPAPSGYTTEQWAAAQQQNWAQWQQWQQQYQQWQTQYGEKYQETMKHMSAQNMNLANQVSQLPIVQPPPPLPKEDTKPPLPPTTINTYQFTSMPPPHQNNLPLFPAKQNANAEMQTSVQSYPQNPPLPPNQPPLPPESSSSSKEGNLTGKRGSSSVSESSSAKKLKVEDDELTEAEKTFDAQFKQWEEQFNKWKEQNANHPDKTQYKQYEAKWTSWREKLIERREQMRRKREQQKQAVAKAEVEKNKTIPGDEKILNILTSTENQGLINNLLGIGKTLGLTGKQNTSVPPPPPPPPATETVASSVHTSTMVSSSQGTSQVSTSQPTAMNMMSSNAMTSSPWNSQQWAPQYNTGVNVSGFPNYQSMTGVPPPPFGTPSTQMAAPNFTQPPPNFAQPPPGFTGNDRQNANARPSVPSNMQGRPPPFGSSNVNSPDGNHAPTDRLSQTGPPGNFGNSELNRQKDGAPLDRFGRDGTNEQGNSFRPNDLYGQRNDGYKFNDERSLETDQFRRDDRNYQEQSNNQFNQQKNVFGSDRFAAGNDRFGPGSNRFGPNDRFGPGNDRFGLGNDRPVLGTTDRFGPGDTRFGNDRFGPPSERTGQGGDNVSDRYGPNDRFGHSNESFGPGGDRFNRGNLDRKSNFDPKDTGDRRGFNRPNQFQPPDKFAPELKKLMEKRRAAFDVFRPSFLDSDKSCNVGSLSESFKRITGDSPFMKSGNNNFGPRGPPGPSNFRMPGDLKPQGNFDFGPRYPMGIGRNTSIDLRDGVPFRGPTSSPQQVHDPINTELRSDTINLGNDTHMIKENKGESVGGADQTELTNFQPSEQNIDNTRKDDLNHYSVSTEIPLLEKSPWTEGQFPADNSAQKDPTNMSIDGENSSSIPLEQDTQNVINEATETNQDVSGNDNGVNKKTEVLPFMGENDPKPEDLNMEPPPELPNLGPVTTGTIEPMDPLCRTDGKESSPPPLLNRPDCPNPGNYFDPAFGPKGMQFRPNAPFLGPRGPNDSRFPMFEPRGPMPFSPTGPNAYSLGPRGPNVGQFGLRGPNSGQFDSRSPSEEQFRSRGPNDGPFAPRGPNNGLFAPRGPNNGPFGPRGSNIGQFGPRYEGQFGPRRPNEGQFGPRGPSDGQFGPRGPSDGQFGPRGPGDGQFGPRGPSDGLFGPRGPSDGQFGPRGPNDGQFGPRGPNDGQFGPRGPSDGQFGPRGPNDSQFMPQGPNRQFGLGRPNDASFDNRGPNNLQFPPRGSNEGQPKFSGPSDTLFGSRRNETPHLRSPSGSKGTFDTPADGSFGPQGQSDTFFGSRGSLGGSNDSFTTRDKVNNMCSKNRENSDAGNSDTRGDGGVFKPKDQMPIEPGIQQGKFDSNDKQNPGWRQQFSKNVLGDTDQRSGQDFGYNDKPMLARNDPFNQTAMNNMERRSPLDVNKSNVPDIRSDKTMSELTIGETSSGSEYSKFNSPNTYMKRPMDNRQSQVRCPTVKEFCIERQFNYNHAGATTEKKFVEHIPAKVVDYAHTSHSSIQDHLTPVQCFDYGHGNLKPLVPEREAQPKKDFKDWEENEQNLKEYTEKIRSYEHYSSKTDGRSGDYRHRRHSNDYVDDKRAEREYREKDDYRPKDRDDRIFDRVSSKNQDSRHDKNANKERTRERCEPPQKETNKEHKKDEDRSKGNVNWQENSNKSIVETIPSDSSVTDTQHNVLEPAPKTLELAKTPNCTMVDDLLCPPGRQNRPPKIAIILRGPPGSGKSFVAKLIKDREVEQGGSAPRILSLDDYFLVEKEIESTDDNGKKVTVKDMVYEYEEAMEQSYITSLVKAFKKNITDGFFSFIILDCINEKICDYEEMWSFAKTKGFKVYVCEMEMDLQICLKRNIHNRTEDEINRIIDYFEPTPSYHQKLDVNSMLQDQAIEEVHMEDSEETQEKVPSPQNEDSQDSQEDTQDGVGVSKWERMEAEDKLDRLDGLARKKNEGKVQTMKDFLQVPDYYNMEDTSGKKRVRWADLEERKEQEKMRAVGFVVGHTNWDRMMDPTKGGSALTRTKYI